MKNKNIKNLIEDLLTEASLDPRIENGIFNLYNGDHLDVLIEQMESKGIDKDTINEFIESLAMDEGKYPERQAYNKDGWLVTFPSKEYRDAAIKKKTHFGSDPTHGKGGMNLYYKKKGKQKRQTAQDVSKSEPTPAPVATKKSPVPAQVAQGGVQKKQQVDPAAANKAQSPTASSEEDDEEYYDDSSAASIENDKEKLRNAFGFKKPTASSDTKPTDNASAPAIDVPVVTQAPEEYATISKKFASQKRWMATEYGEYRDAEGNTVAVVGLSGEAVPIRTNDREEYKIFAEKMKS